MSDKSFGDHTNRNIVKNPLLSSAVTGLSLEDLTHKAVLLPAAPSQTLITRSAANKFPGPPEFGLKQPGASWMSSWCNPHIKILQLSH
ncbi:hypothetical protein K1T71_015136 [Dendrolimus kikuchii]|nr:hypothetical protein K1T71_015136 [Dendrolimus kikuchii]